MAVSTTSSFIFTSPASTFDSKPYPHSISSVKYRRPLISAACSTTAAYTDSDKLTSLRKTCSSSLYEVLGVRIGADAKEVKAAYRRLARVLHPDVVGTESSAQEIIKLHSAYSTLSDPEKRANYDRTLFQRRAPVRCAASGFRSRRSWETDQCW